MDTFDIIDRSGCCSHLLNRPIWSKSKLILEYIQAKTRKRTTDKSRWKQEAFRTAAAAPTAPCMHAVSFVCKWEHVRSRSENVDERAFTAIFNTSCICCISGSYVAIYWYKVLYRSPAIRTPGRDNLGSYDFTTMFPDRGVLLVHTTLSGNAKVF